ncbi:MFS transporter [bacterium]|nr:MFS transporter [bacterium]
MTKWNLIVERFSAYGFLKNLTFFTPFIILFFRQLGFSFLEIGLLFAIAEIVTNLAEIPSGILADLVGRRRVLIVSFLFYMISFGVFYFLQHYWLAAIAMVFFGCGEAFRSGTHKAMIMTYADIHGRMSELTEIYGITRSWSQMGAAVSSLLAAVLVLWKGEYRIIFLVSIFPYILDLLVVATYPKELDGNPKTTLRLKEVYQFVFAALKEVLKNSRLRLVLLNSALDKSFYKTAKDYLQPFLFANVFAILPFSVALFSQQPKEKTAAIAIGVVYSLVFFINAVAARQAKRISRQLGGQARTLNRLYLLYVIVFAAAAVALNLQFLWLVVAVFIVLGALQNIRRPILVAYLGALIQSEQRATIMSVETQLQTLFTIVMAPLLGLAVDLFGIQAVFVFAFVIFGGLGSILQLRHVERPGH